MGNEDFDKTKLEETIDTSNNFLSVIILPTVRVRRDAEQTTTYFPSTTTTDNEEVFKKPEGYVIYSGQSSTNNLYTLLYSSQPLLLQVNGTRYYLPNIKPDLIIVVNNRLNLIIPVSGVKFTLRFNFALQNGYWSLLFVRVEGTIIPNSNNISLTTPINIGAPTRFSYHCTGETVLSDSSGSVSLTMYDLQLQIDAKKDKFDAASDCVNFTTVPIWSGIFVTALLGVGLIIALIAIMDIKTMDKFDNQKTKQLSITISE